MWLNVSSASCGRISAVAENAFTDLKQGVVAKKEESEDKNVGSPLMRYKHAVCSSQSGHIYLHGGRYGNEPLDDDLWRFDPHENIWKQLSTSGLRPPSLQEHTLIEHDECLYLFGGQVSAGDSENSFWRLDLNTQEWQSLNQRSSRRGAHLEPSNRRGHSAVSRGNCMYVFGGFEDFRGSSGQLWEFDFRTQLWQLRDLNASSSSKPEPRHGHSAIIYGDSMYIYGGLSNLKPLSDLWRWSWTEKRWFRERTRGRSPGHLHGHTAIQAFGSMFIFGGERKGLTTRALWRLNLSNMCWHKIRSREPQPSPTTWHGAVINPLNKLDEMNYIVECANQSSIGLSSENFDQGACRSQNSSFIAPSQPLNSVSAGNLKGLAETHRDWRKKRGSRLAFLRRLRRRTVDNRPRSNSAIEHLPVSLSASNVVVATSGDVAVSNQPLEERTADSPEIHTTVEGQSKQNGRHAVHIIDNLNEDIKQMFENHSLEPEDQTSEKKDEQISKQDQTWSSDVSQYVTVQQSALKLNPSADLVSQRTSCSYATPMSEMSIESNFLANQKVASVLNRAERHAKALEALRNKSVCRDARPKSEIVQSLIERADSSIKHMYTPFFKRSDPKRLSLGDPTKRHTLPQTMTYYNLYFGEELSELSMPSEHHLSSSTIKPSTSTQYSNGVLVGVHGIPSIDSQKVDDSSQISLGLQSSNDSRTLCAQDTSPEASGSTIGNIKSIPSALTMRRDTGDEGGDNTSLSFSAIAEFEEDDMLQYACPESDEKSPVEKNSPRNFRGRIDESSGPEAMDSDEMSIVHSAIDVALKDRGQKRAHKSTSSGYHSGSGYANSSKSTHLEQGEQQDADTGSSLGGFTSETSPEQTAASRQVKSLRANNDQKIPVSSTTVDSLTVLSTSETSKSSVREGQTESGSSGLDLERSLKNHPIVQTQPKKAFRTRLFGEQKAKTRYWQLCMFVIGGKQSGTLGLNEPINVWRLYI